MAVLRRDRCLTPRTRYARPHLKLWRALTAGPDRRLRVGEDSQGVDHVPLTSAIEVRLRYVGALHPPSCPAGELPRRRGGAPNQGAISSNGNANRSWSTNATRSAGARVSSTTRSARPTAAAPGVHLRHRGRPGPAGLVHVQAGRRAGRGRLRPALDDAARRPVHDLVLTVVRKMAKLPVIPIRADSGSSRSTRATWQPDSWN